MNVYQTTRRVEFRDTDAAGIMHFTAFFDYMESAEHEFFRHLGTSVVLHNDEMGTVSWPRVSAQCQFKGVVRFEDVLEIRLHIARLGATSISYQCQFHCAGDTVADGEVTAVCCRIDQGAPIPIPIPTSLAEKLADYVADPQA